MSTLPANKVQDSHTRAQTAGGAGELTRVTVNLTPRAVRALEKSTEITGHSTTDVINRATQLYSYLEQVNSDGGRIFIRDEGRDDMSELRLI
ncbi:hypothetical protein AB0N89_01190 [Amycolatopsis sp. NPDC089917]|uniref:hypothetical protein n=1 Tax=Amycolatopsis sp. NPDC089917 TaxID=3155187 RepID=UPI003444485E